MVIPRVDFDSENMQGHARGKDILHKVVCTEPALAFEMRMTFALPMACSIRTLTEETFLLYSLSCLESSFPLGFLVPSAADVGWEVHILLQSAQIRFSALVPFSGARGPKL